MSTSAVFPEIHQVAQVDGQVVRLRKLQNPFGAVIPAGEALNILEGTFFMRIRVFTPPERASGDIFPITGLSITALSSTVVLSMSRIISLAVLFLWFFRL